MVVLFQVRLSHDSEDVPGDTRALRRAGVLIFVSAAGFAAAALLPAWAAATALVLADGVYAVAEMLQSAGPWGLPYTLAPEDRHGEYQGAFGSGTSAGLALAPLIATSPVIANGGWGWLIAGLLLLAGTFVMTPLANAALRAKEPTGDQPAPATTCSAGSTLMPTPSTSRSSATTAATSRTPSSPPPPRNTRRLWPSWTRTAR